MALQMGNWGFNHYKWSYNPTYITGFPGPHLAPFLPLQRWSWHGVFLANKRHGQSTILLSKTTREAIKMNPKFSSVRAKKIKLRVLGLVTYNFEEFFSSLRNEKIYQDNFVWGNCSHYETKTSKTLAEWSRDMPRLPNKKLRNNSHKKNLNKFPSMEFPDHRLGRFSHPSLCEVFCFLRRKQHCRW